MFKFFKHRKLREMIRQAYWDNELTDKELEEIDKYVKDNNLNEDIVNKERLKHSQHIIQPKLQEIAKKMRFSPEDEAKLDELFTRLQIAPNYSEEFRNYRQLWKCEETGEFPLIAIENVPAGLKNGEEVYYSTSVSWLQHNVRKQIKGYVGGSIGFRIAKGVRISVGKAVPQYDIIEEMKNISDGTLYVTNKRVLFNGYRKSTNITMGRIVDYEIFKNGVEIQKSSGTPDFFKFEQELDGHMMHYILNELLK